MYDDIQTLMAEIAAGEDSYLELKEVVFRGDKVRFGNEEGRAQVDIAEVLVSMANTAGGVVLFGVNRDRVVVGVDRDRRDLLEQFVVNLARDLVVPPLNPILNWVELPGPDGGSRLCLKVDVTKATFAVHQTRDGRHLQRVGSHRAVMSQDVLLRLAAARGLAMPFEERPQPQAPEDALDMRRLAAYYRRRFGRDLDLSPVKPERLLGGLKLASRLEDGRWVATNLGILLFCEEPEAWIPGAFVDVAAYRGAIADGNTSDSKVLRGPVPELIDRVLDYLRSSPLIATVSEKTGLGRRDRPAYSLLALQEGVVNALVHRDYEIRGTQCLVRLFADRIEIWNPGPLVNTLTPENLYAGCLPIRRNQLLAGAMRDFASARTDLKLMESRGEGFLNLVRESERLSGRRPELEVVGTTVKLTIHAALGAAPAAG